ncbi:MAG: 2-dehydropantoate 2-reductase [Pseudomonadales bacterium]|nr:2-dehydropantoate 2-reductase [Pseudomonadales bacterium]
MSTWTILGVGAIGGLMASQFHSAGIPFELVPRQQSSELPSHLSIEKQGQQQSVPCRYHQKGTPISHLLLTTKSHQTKTAIDCVAEDIGTHSVIVVLQNGMGSTEYLADRFPQATVLGATTTHGAYRKDPYTIVHAGEGATWFGPLNKDDTLVAKSIVEDWQAAGLAIEWDANLKQRLWLKLGINCAINPLTVIHDCLNGELLENPQALDSFKKVAKEFEAIYQALFGIYPSPPILLVVEDVARKTAKNISSMRQDVLNNRPTEIEAINGYLIKQATAMKITCEENLRLYNAIKNIDSN